MKHVRKWVTEDGKEFETKEEAKRHELGGPDADVIADYVGTLPDDGKSERASLAQQTRATKTIAGFLHWARDNGISLDSMP
jgi:hypothetical protein